MKMIDVSQHNGVINWKKVDTDAVIIRIGYRGYTKGALIADANWYTNTVQAIANGIIVGYYFVTQAVNETESIAEADYCIEMFGNASLDPQLPIFLDSEYSTDNAKQGRGDVITKDKRTKCAITFCERIQQKGYIAGVYANTDWFKNQLEVSLLLDYKIWVAQYATKCEAKHRVDIWQYTSKETMNGISGFVDDNIVYADLTNSKNPIVSRETYNGEYRLLENMNVRVSASIYSRKKIKSELSNDAQKHSSANGTLLKGTVVTVKEYVSNADYVWFKIPSGYVCYKKNDKVYLEKVV